MNLLINLFTLREFIHHNARVQWLRVQGFMVLKTTVTHWTFLFWLCMPRKYPVEKIIKY